MNKMLSQQTSKIIFFTVFLWSYSDISKLHTSAIPLNQITNVDELSDLNVKLTNVTVADKQNGEDIAEIGPKGFLHRDEDQPRDEINLNLDERLKYEVEILEPLEIKKETIEIEERYRAPALKMNTDNIFPEEIEVNSTDAIEETHMALTVVLVVMALMSIALYAALVIWRSRLEHRYGMRELLVANGDDCYHANSSSAVQA